MSIDISISAGTVRTGDPYDSTTALTTGPNGSNSIPQISPLVSINFDDVEKSK